MALVSLREQAHELGQALYEKCLSKEKGHSLLRRGFFNAGIWKQSLEKAQKKGVTGEEATLFASFLPFPLPENELSVRFLPLLMTCLPPLI